MTFIYNNWLEFLVLKKIEKRLPLRKKGGNLGKVFPYYERY